MWVWFAYYVFDKCLLFAEPEYVGFGIYALMTTVPWAFLIVEAGRQQRWARNALMAYVSIELVFVVFQLIYVIYSGAATTSPTGFSLAFLKAGVLFVLFHLYTAPIVQSWYEARPRKLLHSLVVVIFYISAWTIPGIYTTYQLMESSGTSSIHP